MQEGKVADYQKFVSNFHRSCTSNASLRLKNFSKLAHIKKIYSIFVDLFNLFTPDFGSFGRVMLIFIPYLMFLVDFWFILLEFGFFFFNFCDFLAILVG